MGDLGFCRIWCCYLLLFFSLCFFDFFDVDIDGVFGMFSGFCLLVVNFLVVLVLNVFVGVDYFYVVDIMLLFFFEV